MDESKYLKDGKIDISDDGITYWSDKIKCNPLDLMYAVSKVGEKYDVLLLFLELNRMIREEG
jgi:hypothetical protein